jgi:two-component system NarL family response regulator
MMKPHNILIVEDDAKQSELLRMLLSGQNRFKVTGTAESYEEAETVLASDKIDLCIVDIDLRGKKTGIDVVKHVSEKYPDTLVLVHTIHADSTVLFDAIRAGAGGYILKGLSPMDFISSVNRICDGDVPISPVIARKILASFKQNDAVFSEKLSEREIELLKMSDQGYQHKQIAQMLNLSAHTVYTHFKNIYQKLHVNNRTSAISKAKKLSYL